MMSMFKISILIIPILISAAFGGFYSNVGPMMYQIFRNATLMKMVKEMAQPIVVDKHLHGGICVEEVLTSSLMDNTKKYDSHVAKGNGSMIGFSKIQVCCKGYRSVSTAENLTCEPVCSHECKNGYCYAPNECRCLEGYILYTDNKCVATCPLGCAHGVCTVYGECSCNAGYKLGPTGKFCVPFCSRGCEGGTCIAPGHCEYHCKKGCGSGFCVGPNKCACRGGMVWNGHFCEVVCSAECKEHGFCMRPNKCICKPGHKETDDGKACLPVCSKPCENGRCTAPDTCTCRTGYIMSKAQKCIPHCPDGCHNGKCTAPNTCSCYPGYVTDPKVEDGSSCVEQQL